VAHLLDKLQHLRLGRTRVAEQQNVNVAPEAHTVRQDLLRAAHEQAEDGFLDVAVAKDGGGDRVGEALVEAGGAGHARKLLLFLGREGAPGPARCAVHVDLEADDAQVRRAEGDGPCCFLRIY
jgi:hypothetical protein